MSTPVCTSFQKTDTAPTAQPIILPPFSAQNYAVYNLSWEIINTDGGNPLDATLQYYYYNSSGNIIVLYSTTFQVAIGASEVNSVTQQFNAMLNGNTIYARISLSTSADINVCVEEGEFIRTSCGSESYAFRDGDYWHIDNVFGGAINTSYSFAANALGTFTFFYFWDFDQGSPAGNENFTISISTVDTSGNITPVVLDNGTNQVSQDVNSSLAGQTQNFGTYNTTNIDYFFVELDGTGPFGLGFRLVCPEQNAPEILETCCDWFANSTKSCYTFEGQDGSGGGDLIAPTPIMPELEHCAPVGCNCVPVFINPEDPENSYENDFSSWLFTGDTDYTFTLQKLVDGAWVDQPAQPWDLFPRGSFSEYPNRSGIIVNWVSLNDTGTFRLKVGENLYSLPHCVELYNCEKETIRFTGEWTQNYTNYRYKGGVDVLQFIEFQDMEEPWPYQIRYHGTLGEYNIESQEKDIITYYNDRNNLHYEKQKESIQACIQDSILDLMQRHIFYVAKGSNITLDEYSVMPIDTLQYLRNYPIVFDNFDGVEYGAFNLKIPQFLVKYHGRFDKMVFSV